ncbi:hypothetical protein ACP70R_021938 [Stipagrostis hirtigluma subsp. patula]
MSHRRRFLNLVTRNGVTAVHSLRRVDLHSRQNNLLYPTAAAAEHAAAAKDPDMLFSGDETTTRGTALNKVKRIRLMGTPTQSFQPARSPFDRSLHCVALSESKTVFLDYGSRGAFLYDAAERRVVSLPSLPGSECLRVYFSVAGAKDDDIVYLMDRFPTPAAEDTAENRFQFHALVRRDDDDLRKNPWDWCKLPPPPYVRDAGYRSSTAIGVGTYCFDMASRTWSKAGEWALPFSGEIVHDPELGLWVGFVCSSLLWADVWCLAATGDLFSAVDWHRLMTCRDEVCRELDQPDEWYLKNLAPQLVGLGSSASSALSGSLRPGRKTAATVTTKMSTRSLPLPITF